jgi:diguanylate cyclase
MSFKRRAQLIIALIVIAVSSILTFFHISNESRYAQERTLHSSENVKTVFDSMTEDAKHFYLYRAYTILHLEGVVDAIKKRDRERLYELTLPRYKTLLEENPHLIVMQYHAAEGHSIVRMHLKDKYGDDIASLRPMLRTAHAARKMVSGFEGGVHGMAYRIVIPVFDNNTYIGALEFGIQTEYFVDKIKQMTGSDSVLMIHENHLGAVNQSMYKDGFLGYRFTRAMDQEEKKFIATFSKDNRAMKPKNVRMNEKDYEINPLFLEDSEGEKAGAIICINDITGGYQNQFKTILESVLITIGLLVLFLSLFEYTFGSLIKKLNFQERYIKTILDSQKNIVVVTDGKEIIFVNQAFYDYFGFTSLEEFRRKHSCICTFFEAGEGDEYLEAERDGLLWTEYLCQNRTKEHKVKMTVGGESSIFTVNIQKMEYEDEMRHVAVFTDITKLNQLATQDVLTQVSNRFRFDQVLEHSVALSERYAHPLSLMIVDIDHFKSVNDTYGHLVGDDVLKKIAKILSEGIRKSDLIARWGGEEFVILLPESELSSAAKLAEALRVKVAESDFTPVEKVTCSIGVVQWSMGDSSDELLKRVDEKLYQAKNSGRNKVRF